MSTPNESREISIEAIAQSIRVVRGQRVLLDRDLAKLYEVKAIALRQQVKRNLNRFPEDFMFRLTEKEAGILVSQKVIPSRRSYGGSMPYAFTQEGIAMLSSVLTSPRAVQVNVSIMRAFIKLREFMISHAELAKRLDQLEGHFLKMLSAQDRKLSTHEQAIAGIFKTLSALMNPPVVRAIGFTADFDKKT